MFGYVDLGCWRQAPIVILESFSWEHRTADLERLFPLTFHHILLPGWWELKGLLGEVWDNWEEIVKQKQMVAKYEGQMSVQDAAGASRDD